MSCRIREPPLYPAPRNRSIHAVSPTIRDRSFMVNRDANILPNINMYSRYSPADWVQKNLEHYASATSASHLSEKVRSEAVHLIKETDDITRQAQREVGRRLGERVCDISFWRNEIDNELDKLLIETNSLLSTRRILERALADTEVPMNVTKECLYYREKRQDVDLVHDRVEELLLKESDTVRDAQEAMRRLLERSNDQLSANRAAQHNLERDTMKKTDAYDIDSHCHQLNANSRGLSFYHGIEKVNNTVSVPDSWSDHSNRNIQISQMERTASSRLRAEIESTISQWASDMWLSWSNATTALQQRASETIDARNKLQTHLGKVSQEIFELERHMDLLKRSIRDKMAPLQLAQTRLQSRTHRPDVELCRDNPHTRLVREVEDLRDTITRLESKLTEAENTLHHLVNTRTHLQQQIKVKTNSTFIDRDQCLGIRKSFPYALTAKF